MNLKFWKKEDDLSLPDMNFGKSELGLKDSTGLDLSNSFEPTAFNPGNTSFNQAPATPSFQQSSFQPPGFQQSYPPPQAPSHPAAPADDDHVQQHIQKDLEVIAAKLDTIRAQLEMLNSRVANLEHNNQGPPKRPWY